MFNARNYPDRWSRSISKQKLFLHYKRSIFLTIIRLQILWYIQIQCFFIYYCYLVHVKYFDINYPTETVILADSSKCQIIQHFSPNSENTALAGNNHLHNRKGPILLINLTPKQNVTLKKFCHALRWQVEVSTTLHVRNCIWSTSSSNG